MTKETDVKLEQETIQLKHKFNVEMHEMKMEELRYIRETNKISHDNELERGRIKSAEIRKALERKIASQYPRG
jgi:hypothetical protein